MEHIDLSRLKKPQLIAKLHSEVLNYDDDLQKLCKLLCDELPRSLVFRIISRMYRIRTTNK